MEFYETAWARLPSDGWRERSQPASEQILVIHTMAVLDPSSVLHFTLYLLFEKYAQDSL